METTTTAQTAKEITIELTFANEPPQLISGRENELLSTKINHHSKLTYIAFDQCRSSYPKHHIGKYELTLINIEKTTFQQVIEKWKKWIRKEKEPTLPLQMNFRLLLLWKCRYGISVAPETKVSDLIKTVDKHENNSDVWWECPQFCSETLKDPDDEEEFKDWKGDQQTCKCYTDLNYPIKIVNQTGEEFIFTKEHSEVSLLSAGVRQKAKLFDSEKPKSLSGNRCSPWCLGNHRSLMPFKDLAYNEAKMFYYNILHAGKQSKMLPENYLGLSLEKLTATVDGTQLTNQLLLSFLKNNFPKQDLVFTYDEYIVVSNRERKNIKFRTVGRAMIRTSTENPRINTVTFVIKSCETKWYQFEITFEGKNFKQMNIHTIQFTGQESFKMVRVEFFHPSSFVVDVDYNATDADFFSLVHEEWKNFPKDTTDDKFIIYFDVEKEQYIPIYPNQQSRKWYDARYSFLQMGVFFFVNLSKKLLPIYSSDGATLKHVFKNFCYKEFHTSLGKSYNVKLLINRLSCNDKQLTKIYAHEVSNKNLKLSYVFKINKGIEGEQTILMPTWTPFQTLSDHFDLQKYKFISTQSPPSVTKNNPNNCNKKAKTMQQFDIHKILEQTPQHTLEQLGFNLKYVYSIC